MATVYPINVWRAEVVANAASPNQVVVIPQGVTNVTVFYKAAASGTTNKIQKTVSSGAAIGGATATWIDVVANVTNTTFTNTAKFLMGTETIVALRASRTNQDVTMIVTGTIKA